MFLTSIILVVDRYFEDQEIIVENLKSANSSLELLILNNFGNVIPELKELSTHYFESNSIIEMNFAECVNVLLPYCSGDYILVFYDYGYMFDDWLKKLISSYQQIENSGVISILSNNHSDEFLNYYNEKDLCYFLSMEENMECKYFDNNVVSNFMFFSKNLLDQVGALNINLNEKYVLWEYCYRAGLLGKYNYYLTGEYSIKISEYTSAYVSNLKDYQLETKSTQIFKILNPDNDYSELLDKLKKSGIEADYSEKINSVIAIKKEFDQIELNVIGIICNELQYNFKIICTGYYQDYIWKGRVALLINKIL